MRDVQSCLGFANLYSDFISIRLRVIALLYKFAAKRKGTENVKLSAPQLSALEKPKQRLIAKPQMANSDLAKPFNLQTDASMIAISDVLQQFNEAGVERPLSFFFKEVVSAAAELLNI